MKILVVLPNKNYFIWQMLVQINNLNKFGYDADTIYLIGNVKDSDSKDFFKKIGKLNTNASFYFYNDDRKNPQYSSSLRPNILKKFFYENRSLVKYESFFYIDPDVLFTKEINFNEFLKKNDKTWYLSDTKSYIDSSYIKSKSDELFTKMCDIVKISPDIVINNNENAGGAQYLLKNVDYKFWEKVEKDSEDLYKLMRDTTNKYSPSNPIQSWTADMWSLLWNAWLSGNETKIHKKLNFSWATDSISQWKKNNLFHNAGVTNQDYLFNKSKYSDNSPFNRDLSFVDKKYCSYNYVNEIKDTEKNFKIFLY